MNNNKFFPLFRWGFVVLIGLSMNIAHAEFYTVYTPPSPPCCTTVERVKVVYVPVYHKKVRHHKPKRHYVKPVRTSSYNMSVYYACPVYGCCGSWAPCNGCGSACRAAIPRYVVYPTQSCGYRDCSYVEYDFNYDQRTADDVGADMNIDY